MICFLKVFCQWEYLAWVKILNSAFRSTLIEDPQKIYIFKRFCSARMCQKSWWTLLVVDAGSCFLCPSVTVFTESLPSDSGDNMSSQSVPMVTASTRMAATDDGDEVFMEQEGEGWASFDQSGLGWLNQSEVWDWQQKILYFVCQIKSIHPS